MNPANDDNLALGQETKQAVREVREESSRRKHKGVGLFGRKTGREGKGKESGNRRTSLQ